MRVESPDTPSGEAAASAIAPQPAVDRASGRSGFLAGHRLFVVALILGAAIRVVVQVAFRPALIHSDGPTYLAFLDHLEPNNYHPAGYGLLELLPLSAITPSVAAVAAVQHIMGLAVAVLTYALLRRWGVGGVLATVATLPVLFDSLQLILEQTVLSDTLFELLLVSAVLLLGWRRHPGPAMALAAGLLLGGSTIVRLIAEPMVLAGVAYCLLAGDGWKGRLKASVAVVVGFAVPVGAYATWYHAEHGVFALSQFTGKSLYMRTTSFVDCTRLSVPRYERVLCPREPLGQRRDPSYYGWEDRLAIPRLKPPPGVTRDAALRQFAMAAIRQQPAGYAEIVARDFVLNFDLWRTNRFEYYSASKWNFSHYPTPRLQARARRAYARHGGQLTVQQPYAHDLAEYQRVVYIPGPLLLACLLLGLLGAVGAGRARRSGKRSMCALLTVTGTGLLLLPDMTDMFSWRYQLPAFFLLPAGAALAITALRRSRPTNAAE
jgi:hypothetical protein